MIMVGMTVYSAASQADGTKLVSNRRGVIVEVVRFSRSYRVKWHDKTEADVHPWVVSDLSFTPPDADEVHAVGT